MIAIELSAGPPEDAVEEWRRRSRRRFLRGASVAAPEAAIVTGLPGAPQADCVARLQGAFHERGGCATIDPGELFMLHPQFACGLYESQTDLAGVRTEADRLAMEFLSEAASRRWNIVARIPGAPSALDRAITELSDSGYVVTLVVVDLPADERDILVELRRPLWFELVGQERPDEIDGKPTNATEFAACLQQLSCGPAVSQIIRLGSGRPVPLRPGTGHVTPSGPAGAESINESPSSRPAGNPGIDLGNGRRLRLGTFAPPPSVPREAHPGPSAVPASTQNFESRLATSGRTDRPVRLGNFATIPLADPAITHLEPPPAGQPPFRRPAAKSAPAPKTPFTPVVDDASSSVQSRTVDRSGLDATAGEGPATTERPIRANASRNAEQISHDNTGAAVNDATTAAIQRRSRLQEKLRRRAGLAVSDES